MGRKKQSELTESEMVYLYEHSYDLEHVANHLNRSVEQLEEVLNKKKRDVGNIEDLFGKKNGAVVLTSEAAMASDKSRVGKGRGSQDYITTCKKPK